MSIQQLIFDALALIAMIAALMVILSNNPVRSALSLVLAFFAMAGIWLFAEAEFLALILILVYVGAVMTLFLFVIMMLDIERVSQKRRFVRYVPLAALMLGLLIFMLFYLLRPEALPFPNLTVATVHDVAYSNTKNLGEVLYTNYVLAFELAAVLLLVAIIAAISLSHRDPRECKVQEPRRQIQVTSKDRLRLVKMEADKGV